VAEATDRVELLVLGLGNVLCRDDGLGPAVVAHFERQWSLPVGCVVADGGTLGLALLPMVEDARRVLLIDAVRLDAPPGTPVRLAGSEIEPAVRERLSVHQVGVADVVDALRLRGRMPEELVLLGAVPGSVGLGLGLTEPVAAALPGLVASVVAEAARLGFPCHRREEVDARPAAHARALFGL
jgi:hydrogenase maturation protease